MIHCTKVCLPLHRRAVSETISHDGIHVTCSINGYMAIIRFSIGGFLMRSLGMRIVKYSDLVLLLIPKLHNILLIHVL